MKQLIAMILALCLTLSACRQGPAPENSSEGDVTYTVTVVTEEGMPVSGVMVQLCMDVCYPGTTDSSGQVTYRVPEGAYKVSILAMPAGFAYSDENREYSFDGGFDVTITLKADPA